MRNLVCYMMLFVMMGFIGSCTQEKKTNWKVNFNKNSKDPYGCYLAYHLLEDFFPSRTIHTGQNLFTEINQALDKPYEFSNTHRVSIVMARDFEVDSLEFDKIIRYIQLGNTVCILSENYSKNIFDYFHLSYDKVYQRRSAFLSGVEDTLQHQQLHIFFNHQQHTYTYNGIAIEHGFRSDTTLDSTFYFADYAHSVDTPSSMISYDSNGMFMICRHPITMTNDFILQNNNREYLEYFLSYFPEHPTAFTWYTFYDRKARENTESGLSNLLKFPPLFYAFLILLMLFILYVLFEGRRRQKPIPILASNTNASLEFVETVGMLYYNKKDNKNLSEKMILHYLENVRSKYGLKTNELNEEFVNALSHKINQSYTDTNAFIAYIAYIRAGDDVTEIDIRHLHHQLKKFS